MPISQAALHPLFAVVGSTGNLGGSVVRAIAASKTANFRVRALTRDPTAQKARELAKLGCEVVAANVDDRESLNKAFEGATYVYGQTISDYSEFPSHEQELGPGKAQIDAAVAQGAEVFVWMGAPDHDKLSGGKFPIPTWDIKERIAEYGRQQKGLTFRSVIPGSFNSNYIEDAAPRKNDDGTFTLALPVFADTKLPQIDVPNDYGKYVLAACRPGTPSSIIAGGPRYMTPVEMCEDFSKVSGKKVTFFSMPDNMFMEVMKPVVGERMADGFLTMWRGIRETGYYGPESLEPSNALIDEPLTTFLKALRENREAMEKIFA